jgi:signal transduction histidine kinase
MLLFLTIAIFGMVSALTNTRAGFESPRQQFLMALVATQPYLLLRVASNVTLISKHTLRVHLVILFVLQVYIVMFPWMRERDLTLLMGARLLLLIYIVVMIPIAGWLLWKASNAAGGITRHRLRYSGAGALLYAITILLEGIEGLWINTRGVPLLGIVPTSLFGVASAVAFTMGFFPPRLVRNSWQLKELTDYLRAMRIKLLNASQTQLFAYLRTSALRTIGGQSGAYGTLDINKHSMVYSSEGTQKVIGLGNELTSLLDHIWNSGYPVHVKRSGDQEMNSIWSHTGGEALYVVPVRAPRTKVILFLSMRSPSLFVEDDLSLLGLYVDQTIILLEYNALLEKQRELVSSLRGYGSSLETKVAERTFALQASESELSQRVAQLTALNTELEAFSYSVSHDLRAPLRAINGFSRALMDDYGTVLDNEGRGYLDRVLLASKRMDRLIDDLLKLSRLSRQQFQRTDFNLSEMCQQVMADLMAMDAAREIDLYIQPNMQVNADSQLVRILLENLLGNAWKFTGKTEQVQISVTLSDDIFQIQDNGAGFDPIYAKRLFVAFQRLHGMDEFEGTGVGLATALRIVNRHGGRIWADGVPGQGATFYFTLN